MWEDIPPETRREAERLVKENKTFDWVPYQQRRSSGELSVTSDDEQRTAMKMEVAGCGYLIVTADAIYSPLLEKYTWDQTAILKARIE